jgi:hypothetical protein
MRYIKEVEAIKWDENFEEIREFVSKHSDFLIKESYGRIIIHDPLEDQLVIGCPKEWWIVFDGNFEAIPNDLFLSKHKPA